MGTGRRGEGGCVHTACGSGISVVGGTEVVKEGPVSRGSESFVCGCGGGSATGRMWRRFLLYVAPLD